MLDLYEQKQKLARLGAEVKSLYEAMKIAKLCDDIKRLEVQRAAENFWLDVKNAQKVEREFNGAQKKIESYTAVKKRYDDACSLVALVEEMQEESEFENVKKEVDALEADVDALNIEALLTGKYDNLNAILSLHAGAGGTEAQDWNEMLYRMYARFAEKEGYTLRELDRLDGDDAGIKSVAFLVSGENAYGYLKAEMGVHRLVRISPFDANKRRHTSFASLEVMPELSDEEDVPINLEELRIDTFRSGGAGGQNVNKVESAIRITHLPTGIVVQCQNERSQLQNRETAMKMLQGKLAETRERERLAEAQSLKGDIKKIEWGSQIRSYVFCPYTMVKDHRTNYEQTDVYAVMDGDIKNFILEYLKKS